MMKAKQQSTSASMAAASHGRTESDPKKITEPKCTTPPRTAHAQPHVHSPCAQPLDDGWLPHVKMLQLLAGFEGEGKAAHRLRRGSWPRSGWLRGDGRRGGGRRASRRWRRGAPAAMQRCRSSAVLCGPGFGPGGGRGSCMLATRAVRVLYMYIKLATREGGGVLCCRRGSGFHTH